MTYAGKFRARLGLQRENPSLGTISEILGIKNSRAHRALADAVTTAYDGAPGSSDSERAGSTARFFGKCNDVEGNREILFEFSLCGLENDEYSVAAQCGVQNGRNTIYLKGFDD